MIIDFHTHIFPDEIAKKAVSGLETEGSAKAHTDGTLQGLKDAMKKDNIDISVVLPVMTRPSHFDTVNHFAASINGTDGVYSFGGIHPDNDHIEDRLLQIKDLGLKGIKLHPDYQGPTYIDDERYIRIIRTCIELDLCVVLHAGMDIGKPVPIHCPPDRTYLMLKEVLKDCHKDSKIILAHMGGMLQWELVDEFICGQNVYLDFAYCHIPSERERFVNLIDKHGADRILYASDSPWGSQRETADYIEALPLSSKEKDLIFFQNARRLLDII